MTRLPSRRFAVLSTPRSGSNWLCRLLDSHPSVRCHFELFNPHRAFLAGQHVGASKDLDFRKRAPLTWLDDVVAETAEINPELELIGFKLHLDHRPAVLRHLIFNCDDPLILIDRRDRLAQFASLLNSQRTGRYCDDNRIIEPLDFDFVDYKAFVDREELPRMMMRTLISRRNREQRLFEIDYEEIGEPSVRTNLAEFFGIEAPQAWLQLYPRQETVPASERFRDFDTIESIFAANAHIGNRRL